MQLTIFTAHVKSRCKERLGIMFHSDREYCVFFGDILADARLEIILDKVPAFSHLVLYVEKYDIYLFMQIGTRFNSGEVKISTVYKRSKGHERVLVDTQDYCYILPEIGKLRFGKEKKYFVLKKHC